MVQGPHPRLERPHLLNAAEKGAIMEKISPDQPLVYVPSLDKRVPLAEATTVFYKEMRRHRHQRRRARVLHSIQKAPDAS